MRRWNPWTEIDELKRNIDELFSGASAQRPPNSRFVFLPGRSARTYPYINFNEDSDKYYIYAVAPGINPDALDISITGETLTLKGEKYRIDKDVSPEAFHRSERSAGKFTRTIDLPDQVNTDQVDAEYKNGILFITLPKADEVKPKTITVKIS